jgi:hypothetical protein
MKNCKNQIKILLLIAIFGICFVWSGIVFADQLGTYQPLVPIDGSIDTATANNLPKYLEAIFKLAIGLAALFAVIMITVGGIQYMTSESIGGKEDGKERIENAVIGLLLAISSWLILYTVNPKTIEFNFNPSRIDRITPPGQIDSGLNSTTTPQQYPISSGQNLPPRPPGPGGRSAE